MLVDFHSLYDRYSRDVYRFALYLSGDPSLAEEIAQETFVRAWVTPDEIRGGTVKGYLLTIARHLFLAEGRRRGRQVALDAATPDRQPGPEAGGAGGLRPPAGAGGPPSVAGNDRAAPPLPPPGD